MISVILCFFIKITGLSSRAYYDIVVTYWAANGRYLSRMYADTTQLGDVSNTGCRLFSANHGTVRIIFKAKRPCLHKRNEGRGTGLSKKIRAFKYMDVNLAVTHTDALRAIGCESDVRQYNSAGRFIKHRLQVNSIRLFTNNPYKMEAVRNYLEPMPTLSSVVLCTSRIFEGKE
jgi:hypothetical protein